MNGRRRGRPATSETKRVLKAREARRIVDEELTAMSLPSLAEAKNRAAARLGISLRTLLSRLADAAMLKHSLDPSSWLPIKAPTKDERDAWLAVILRAPGNI